MHRTRSLFRIAGSAWTLLCLTFSPYADAQRLDLPPLERAVPYSVRDLGAVSATNGIPLGCINSSGLFYGTRRDGTTNFNQRAFWRSGGATGDLFYVAGWNSWSQGCNDNLEAVGTRNGRAIVWDIDWAGAQVLPDDNNAIAPFVGLPFAEALGVNASRQVVGYVTTSLAEWAWTRATLWTTDTTPNRNVVTRLDLGNGVAKAINGAGQIAGTRTDAGGWNPRAVLWGNDAARTPRLLFATTSQAFDINASGQAVGSVVAAGNLQRGFLANANTGATTLLAPNANIFGIVYDTACATFAINDSGVAVGQSWNANPNSQRAAIWFGMSARNLNTGVPTGTPTLTVAVDINNAGQILCEGWVNGVRHAYLLTPTGAPWRW